MIKEARLERDEHGGLVPVTDGWFVVNLGEARWLRNERFGCFAPFEGPEARFTELGVNVHVVAPGQPACHYHRENCQEDFLVLFGECKVLIQEQERSLRPWDFVHCAPGVDHVFVGAGQGPCAILMMGTRKGDATRITYPVSDLARRQGAGVAAETEDPAVSYAGVPKSAPIANPWMSLVNERRSGG